MPGQKTVQITLQHYREAQEREFQIWQRSFYRDHDAWQRYVVWRGEAQKMLAVLRSMEQAT